MTSTQRIRLLMWLAHHKRQGITQLEATTELGILRLSERVRELQAAGYSIVKQTVKEKYHSMMNYLLLDKVLHVLNKPEFLFEKQAVIGYLLQ